MGHDIQKEWKLEVLGENFDATQTYPSSVAVSNIWKDICSVGSQNSTVGAIIQDGFKIKEHSREATKFWYHRWLGYGTLKEEYSRLCLLSTQKAVITYKWNFQEQVMATGSCFLKGTYLFGNENKLRSWSLDYKVCCYIVLKLIVSNGEESQITHSLWYLFMTDGNFSLIQIIWDWVWYGRTSALLQLKSSLGWPFKTELLHIQIYNQGTL